MPIYEYCCEKCGEVFEEWQSNFEEREVPCPECGGNSKRIISNTSFVLKGTGWYVTDYSGKNASFGAKDESSPKGNGNGSDKGSGASESSSGGDSKAASGSSTSSGSSAGSASAGTTA